MEVGYLKKTSMITYGYPTDISKNQKLSKSGFQPEPEMHNPIQELIQNVNLIPKEKKRIGVV